MIIRDPIWKNIELNDICAKIIQTPEFKRLNEIKQLGPTYMVYPGATHTRFAHSIGVYHIATRLIHNLLDNGANWFSKEEVLMYQIASLCHDLGHFPYTHALKELPLKDHEVLTGEIILNSEISSVIKNEGLDPNYVAAIVDKELISDNQNINFFRKLLSGVLDPDKLDYLNRDAIYCGVPYGIQDTDYTLSCLHPDKLQGITINSKSIVAVENLLFSKYLMYKTVYWHKDVRIATAMMKKSLFSAINEKIIEGKDLYNLTDAELFAITEQSKNECWYCAKKLKNNEIYQCIYETNFRKDFSNHKKLENLEIRTKVENKIAQELKIAPHQILIDIPENISFESDLWIEDEKRPFNESSTVFKKETVKSFTENLRKIRVLIDPKIFNSMTEKEINQIEKNIKFIISEGKNENS